MPASDHIQILINKAVNNDATAEELKEIIEEIKADHDGATITAIEQILHTNQAGDYPPVRDTIYWKNFTQEILAIDKARHERENAVETIEKVAKVLRIQFLRTAWFRYAAAILIIIAAATIIFIIHQNENSSVTQNNPVPVQNDVAPGGNRAVLTLANGSKIILDNAANGTIAKEGAATITKKDDKVVYTSPVSLLPTPVSYNIMSTPRGGQYQLTLPDGSQVWLNAESSITYPTAFTGKERRVTITGEAYFEVAKDKSKKFIVTSSFSLLPSSNEKQGLQIEVLGTHFNVNTYKEEPTKNITLLEGSVRITSVSLPPSLKSVHTNLTLKPGQQGQLSDTRLSLAANPDVEQVIAWKNGEFNFNNKTLDESLRQIARWYDVEVIYEGKIPQIEFGGEMGRDLNLSQVVKALTSMGVKIKLEGKILIVSS
jgi:transmembrane sensor